MLKLIPRKSSSIQTRLLISYFILIVFIAGFIGIGIYKVSERIIEEEVGRSRTEVLNQISRNIGTLVNEIESVSNLYCLDDDLIGITNSAVPKDPYDREIEKTKVNNIFTKYIYAYDMMNIKYYPFLYTFNGKTFSYLLSDWYKNFSNITGEPWYKEMEQKNGSILWVSTFNDKEGNDGDHYVFSAARLLKHKITGKPMGVLLLNIQEEVLYNAYKSALGKSNIIYIMNRDGRIVSCEDKNLLEGKFEDADEIERSIGEKPSGSKIIRKSGGRVLVSFYNIPSTEWSIVEEVPLAVLLSPLGMMRYMVVGMLLASLLIALALSYFIARRISSPIKTLYNLMREVRKGNMEVAAKVTRNDEVGELATGFNRMLHTIKELMQDIRKEEQLKRRAELDFLQAQINPHFMYNSLYSIKCMVIMERKEPAENMLTSFIRLLRKIFHNEAEFISVREEISILKDYILIQSYRYTDNFDVVYDIEEGISDCRIPKLILQPLVENAIFHGIEPGNKKGMILVRGTQEEDCVCFEVRDNGVGMTDEQINSLWERKHRDSGGEFTGVGISNVHERLLLNYGEGYGLTVRSTVGEGTTVQIRLPFFNGREHV